MARLSTLKVLLSLLICCLLAEKVLCRPNANEDDMFDEEDDDYVNDDDGDYDDDDGDGDDSDTYSGAPPEIKSKPLHLEVHQGEKVLLPCDAINLTRVLEVYSVVWNKENTLLYLDKFAQGAKDKRITYNSHDNSLMITNVNTSDSGMYNCSFSSKPRVEVVHTVKVFAPAEVKGIEPSGPIHTIQKGQPLTLKCNVAGYPTPSIKWTKKGKHDMQDGNVVSTSTNISFSMVERRDSGTYQCTAINDQGLPSSSNVTIRVQYAPEIDVEEELVASGVGYEALLKCVVHADPKAKVHWLKNNQTISEKNNIDMYHEGNKYFFKIMKTQDSDFDKYACIASNALGTTTSKVIEVTGKPNTPEFSTAKIGPDGRSLNIEWRIVSYSPIIEYKLLYKAQKAVEAKWQAVGPPVEDAAEGNVYILKYQLLDLPPGDFLVTLRARNGFGWTNQAKPYPFTIKEENHEVTAETSKLEEGGSPSSANTRTRIMAILTIISLSSFFL